MKEEDPHSSLAAFALIYLTFFLDNVLLTVLVPIIPEWVRGADGAEGGGALALWALTQRDAPRALPASLLNSTVAGATGGNTGGVTERTGRAQAVAGAVLGMKAAVQLAAAGPAAAAVCRKGPAAVLRAATALLALAAMVFWACSLVGAAADGAEGEDGAWARRGRLETARVWAAGAGRAVHGAGAAGAGVAGLALAAALPPPHAARALPALLGAVALGVLVGYPFGGAASAMWQAGAPFLLLAAAFIANLAMQHKFLEKQQYNMPADSPGDSAGRCGLGLGLGLWARQLVRSALHGATGACAGCVLLSTSVMAALEPLLPLWLREQFHAAAWQAGLAFVPDSTGYLLAASALGGFARRVGAERVAITGQVVVGCGALALPAARSPWALAAPQFLLGAGLGAVDAALVPALLARAGPRRAAHRAALFQMSGSAAYALGPVCGGAAAWAWGAGAALRALGLLNLLYAAALYRALTNHPLSEQWGARADGYGSESDSEEEADAELAPLRYTHMR